MKSDLINFIVCPKCRSKFHLKPEKEQNVDIDNGTLICTKNHKFPIIHGVPRLVVDTEKNFEKTEDAFSSKWKTFNKSYHNKQWYDKQRKWFLDRFGWKTISNLTKFLKKCEYILDAGTGVGNSAHWFSKNKKPTVAQVA